MRDRVPLATFDHEVIPVVAVGGDGRLRYWNRAAAHLLDLSHPGHRSPHCWEAVGFRAADGTLFCRPDCPIQSQIRSASMEPFHRAYRLQTGGHLQKVEILTFVVPEAPSSRAPVIHLLRPQGCVGACCSANEPRVGFEGGKYGLSIRETEILDLLARGARTSEIGSRLGIRLATVRNHIARLLHKMGVRRRIEAVLIAAGRYRPRR
jgi:DNA-binding CsgD family transcriptional regulator